MSGRSRFGVRRVRSAAILAGAAALTAGAGTASAIGLSTVRTFLRWSSWSQQGALGQDAVVAIVEGGHPRPDHAALSNTVDMQLSWPWIGNSNSVDDLLPQTRNWYSTHATAAASAIAGNGASGITGLAPSAAIISAAFASGINPQTGLYTNQSLTSFAFSLFVSTDQGLANSVADALGVERWRVASVVNSSFGTPGARDGREGEDMLSRLYNICAFMTGATIIAPVGEDGNDQNLLDNDPFEGTANAPSTGFNVLAVGRTTQDFSDVSTASGGGELPIVEYGVAWMLAGPMPDPLSMPPFPTERELFEKRAGVDIVAPGTNLRLAGSLAEPADAPGPASFSDFWTGTSFATALVSSAAALVHDIGFRDQLFFNGRPSNLVTKAVLLNSATKLSGFNNDGQVDPSSRIYSTTKGLDAAQGAGQLNFQRLLTQFAGLKTIKDYDGILVGFTRNPETGGYDLPGFGTSPLLGFVTAPGGLPGAIHGGGDPGGEAHTEDQPVVKPILPTDPPPPQVPPGRPFQGITPDDPPLGGRPDPGLGGNSPSGVGTIAPPREVEGGGGDGHGPGADTAGWDHGRIGVGSIDFPIGFVTENATILATVVWNRTESWTMPNFAGPMAFVDPTRVFAPGFYRPLVPPAAAAHRAAAAIPPVAGAKPRALERRYHTIGADGECFCGAKHAVVKNADGTLMPGAQADALINGVMKEAMSRHKVKAVDGPRPRGAVGFDIEYNFGPEMNAREDFKQAMQVAASVWESVIQTPVTVVINAELVELGPNILGATGSSVLGESYEAIRPAMVARASTEEAALLNALPMTPVHFQGDESEFASDFIVMTSANAKALGFDTSIIAGEPDADMIFNTSFPFDLDPSDGIDPGTFDFVQVAIHEIGHALGFISEVDGFFGLPTTLDIFRQGILQTFNDPQTLEDWTNFPREFRTGAECALDTVDAIMGINGAAAAYRYSTGRFGDGRQASHWKDDILLFQENPTLSEVIGVMDPTYSGPGAFPPGYVSRADLLAFSLIGYDIDFLTPPQGSPASVPVIEAQGTDPANPGGGPFEFFLRDTEAMERTLISNSMAMANLDLELWRFSTDGSGNETVATSVSTDANVEHIAVGPDSGGGSAATISPGQYFLRLRWVSTRYDAGGWPFSDIIITIPRPGYRDIPDGEVEYGMAWFVDQVVTGGVTITTDGNGLPALMGDLNSDGVVNATDLASLLSAFGGQQTNNPADLNNDGAVDSTDLALLLGAFSAR